MYYDPNVDAIFYLSQDSIMEDEEDILVPTSFKETSSTNDVNEWAILYS